MTNTTDTLQNAIAFIIDSIEDGHSIEEIENLDPGTLEDFAEDGMFMPHEMPQAIAITRMFLKSSMMM